MRALWIACGLAVALAACAQEKKVAAIPAVYCYKSLAKPDCYDTPQPDDRVGLVGYYGPPPGPPAPSVKPR